jgi:probable F420-dependent oxidoreductase
MRLGLALPQFGAHSGADQITSFARTSEQLGYRSLWVGDRVFAPVAPSDLYPGGGSPERPYPPEFRSVLDPVVVLAAAATSTTTARLGSSTLNAPWHNALLLGRSLTSLDRLCQGRLDVGFGIGWLREEYTATGAPWQYRGSCLNEILDVLHELWNHNPVEYHGRHFELPCAHVDLRPVQPGGPPVLLGGWSPAMMTRIGRRAAGWLFTGWPPTSRLSCGTSPDMLPRRPVGTQTCCGASCGLTCVLVRTSATPLRPWPKPETPALMAPS